jgi:nitrogen-specific signal transduction histidine kinase
MTFSPGKTGESDDSLLFAAVLVGNRFKRNVVVRSIVTEHIGIMTQPPLDPDQARQDLYEVVQQDCSFEEKAESALELGERYLGVDNGHLANIDTEADYWKIDASSDPPDGEYPKGLILDLATTFCRRTVAQNETIALHDAPNQDWGDDPAFEEQELHCYHGSVVSLEDEPYGTVCFVSKQPRERPFSSDETLFAELITRTIEHELQRQRTQEKLDRLDQFASVLSHDLRNPLNVAQGRVDMARKDTDNEHLESAEKALQRMESMIADVLAMARQGPDIEAEDRRQVRLSDLVEECWESVATADATLQITDDVIFYADPDRCQQLFENLIRNAIEHGSPAVRIRVGSLVDRAGFFFEDDGTGIPEPKREEIFETGYSTGGEGIGLGLTIVEGIVSAHHWSIHATEGRDGGARFEVSDVVVDQSI